MKRRVELVRRKHDGRWKRHIPRSIAYRGKADSANIECSCGYVDLVATWYTGASMAKVSSVHSVETWDKIIDAVELFLSAIQPPEAKT